VGVDFGVATEKKRLQPDPCENKDTYSVGKALHVVSHAMLTLLTFNNLRTKYNLPGFAWYDNLDIISTIDCNVRTRTKVDVTY